MDSSVSDISNSENVETYNSNDTRTPSLPLKLVDVANGKLLKQFKIPMKDLMKLEVVEYLMKNCYLSKVGKANDLRRTRRFSSDDDFKTPSHSYSFTRKIISHFRRAENKRVELTRRPSTNLKTTTCLCQTATLIVSI